jgi:flagellar motor switch protein FliG
MSQRRKTGGVDTVAEVLNLVDRGTEKGILEGLETDDPDLVESIRRLMFVFEDILLVNDKGIQAVLKEIDNDELALALKTASDRTQARRCSRTCPSGRPSLIKEDMEYMGPVRVSDVEAPSSASWTWCAGSKKPARSSLPAAAAAAETSSS